MINKRYKKHFLGDTFRFIYNQFGKIIYIKNVNKTIIQLPNFKKIIYVIKNRVFYMYYDNNILEKNRVKYIIQQYKKILLNYNTVFSSTIICHGMGYLFTINNNIISIKLGFSHLIDIIIPNNVVIEQLDRRTILLHCNNDSFLTNFNKKIQNYRNPSIYKKRKGIYIDNEEDFIILKKTKATF